ADLAVAVSFARPVVYRAAFSLTSGAPTASRDCSAAKVSAVTAAEAAAESALWVHGAIGYTEELDLHLWLRRVWWTIPAWGDAGWHRARVADALVSAGTDLPRTP
nr:acyl-CoA dehydrogenase family protein [Micromonospora sp. DSM 115978]